MFRTNDNGAVAAMVRAGMGVAVMPVLCLEHSDPDLTVHHIEPPIPSRVISVAWRPAARLSPIAQRFVAFATETGAHVASRLDPVR